MMYRTTVQPGEALIDAIIRAAATAGAEGYDGYEVVCSDCGQPIADHESPSDCAVWRAL